MSARTRISSTIVRPPRQDRPRLTQPGDAAEREADRLASVALDAQPERSPQPLHATRFQTPVMRQVADASSRETADDDDDEYDVAAQRRSSSGPSAPPGFLDAIGSGGGGRPLEPGIRSRMESGFGHSLGSVRIHDDSHAARLTDAIDARAFTHGRDIFFGGGEYSPGTRTGDRLLAHELAHTLQQPGARHIARQPKPAKGKAKPKGPDPGRMTDAEKIRLRAEVREEARARVRRWRDRFAKDPSVDPDGRARWQRAFDDAVSTARTIPDATQRAARVAYLETERDLFKDEFFAWLMVRGHADYVAGTSALARIADPKTTFGPADLAWLATHRSRMRAGTDAYATFLAESWGYEKRAVQREKLETAETGTGEVGIDVDEDLAKTAADPAGAPAVGALETSTLEERELLEELHSELAEVETEEGLEYDQAALLEELGKLSPEDRKDFYEFARSIAQPAAGGATDPKSVQDVLEMFNRLDPSSREALKVNREMAEAEPGTTQALPESVRLKLTAEVAAGQTAADDVKKIQSDLDRIRAKALPPDVAKELSGVDFGVSPFFDEVAMLLGLLAGAGERSTLVKDAGDELMRAVVALRNDLQRELAWLAFETAALAAVSVASKGLGALIFAKRIRRLVKRLKLVKDLIETARKVYNTALRVKRVVELVARVRTEVPALLSWHETAMADYARLQRTFEAFDATEDLEAKLEAKEQELLERLDAELEGRLGELLEMLLIEEDTPPDELRQILFDIPRGLTAFEGMWEYYNSSAQGKPHFADVLAVRAFRAGRLLFPFVGFAAAEIAAAFRSAFPDRPLAQRALGLFEKALARPDRRRRQRGLFGRLNRKRYTIDDAALAKPHLDDAIAELTKRMDAHEPGTAASEHWAPRWFRRVVRDEIKAVNRSFRTRTVLATPKPDKKKGGAAGPKEMVPLPPLRVRLVRPRAKDRKLTAKIGFSPQRALDVDRLSFDDFAGEGVEFTGDERRKDAIRKFLVDEEYDFAPHPKSGEHLRLRGARHETAARPYLRLTGGRIKKGIDKDDYKPFLGTVVADEHSLPEGYHLANTKGGVNVALKKRLAQQGHQQLGLGDGRKLVEGPGKAAAEVVAPINLKPPRLEGYDYVAAVDATLKAPAQPGVSPFKEQRTRVQWLDLMRQQADLRQRPKAIEGRLGYTIRARTLGTALKSRYLPELREEDDKGHLVARRFGSDVTDPYWNLVPMLRRENQSPGRWYRLESELAETYIGKTATGTEYVQFGLSLIYPTPKTRRPSRFVVRYQAFDAQGLSKGGGEKSKTVPND